MVDMAPNNNKLNAMRGVVDACCGGASTLAGSLSRMLRASQTCTGCVGGCDSCRVPRPFWWPHQVAEVNSYVCPGGVATLRIIIKNNGPRPGKYQVAVLPSALAGNATISEPEFLLVPFERKTVAVSFMVPGDHAVGQVDEPLVWVRGCLEHVVVWRVTASKLSSTVCHEVAITDTPNYEHHWYDHFYCERPCRNANTKG